MSRALLAVILGLLLIACAPDYEDSAHTVTSVTTGNEITLNDGVQIRLLGVANTETNAIALRKYALGQRVQIAFDSKYYPSDIESGITIPAYILNAQGESLNRFLIQGEPTSLALTEPFDSLAAFTAAAYGESNQVKSVRPQLSDTSESNSFHAVPVGETQDLSDLVDELEPAVFLIETNGGSLGTGFFVGPNGLAVSNHHVFKEASAWRVTLADGRQFPVMEVIEDRPERDYVIFRVGKLARHVYLKAAPITPRRASSVYVIGNPKGLERTFTTGVVSALRTIDNPGDLIQFDAAISPGSSGSPVLNPLGEVVGIATFKRTECENCNFAVNIHLLQLARFY
jgi:serine protease Do